MNYLFQCNWIPTYLLNPKKVDGFHVSQSLLRLQYLSSAFGNQQKKKKIRSERNRRNVHAYIVYSINLWNYNVQHQQMEFHEWSNKRFYRRYKPWWMHLLQCYKFHQICNSASLPQQKVPFPHFCVLSMDRAKQIKCKVHFQENVAVRKSDSLNKE